MSALAKLEGAPAGDTLSNGRILIVDDLADNRDILARRFQRRRFETVEAGDGHEALRLIAHETFDLVLLDVMMPNISGLEVLEQIRERFSASALPVIMVTAKGQSEDVVRALDLGANDYVTKPVDFPIVLARATTQIERRRAALALETSNASLRDTNGDLERTLVEHNARLVAANALLQDEIARRLEADSKSAFLAYHDSLTGLPNRHACDKQLPDYLSNARAAGRGLAVLFVDLDGFKNVNDALGHTIGDALIKQVATVILDTIGPADFVARLGGDEFCVVHTSDAPGVSAPALADRLIAMVGEGRVLDGHEVFVGASVGIAIADFGVGDDVGELLKRADLAMYRAKADGRGMWRLFQPELGETLRHRHTMQLELRSALQRSEFDLFFQPIINLSQGRISCFEALLRWDRRPSGPAAPDAFIPIAEETGLIVPIGDWVLRRACEEAARWPADIRVAVNVSPVQFRGRHILTSLVGALASSGLAPERLELELTESVLLHKSEENLQTLQECRALGVRLAMDDFGTGYSSLGYFRSFRFDKVKIDRSFVSGTAVRADDGAVVRAVVGLGKSFGMTTTAEGVETDEQLAYLRDEGCCEVQGFLFGRAQPATKVTEMIERYGAWLRSQ